MLRRQPTMIDVEIEDKEELEQLRKRPAAASTYSSLLHNLSRNKDPASKAQRLGISS
ncbi:hypothetical protein Csa_019232 [Cucumis sativus]|uniref:Uncharacterized protein n=1 Tax=Cucumis sativus TaxID=3659 RepID=A0A0A0LI59_CUCSA|nr:hypothetical protein Csa_019232 [Cucumis sativus]